MNKGCLPFTGVQILNRHLAAVSKNITGCNELEVFVFLIDFNHGRFYDPVAAVGIDDNSPFKASGYQTISDVFKHLSNRHGTQRYGSPETDVSPGRHHRHCGQQVGAEFIGQLSEGYQTRLGRSGGKLSVGQKQRLSIARALVREAPILILDEPTSALDPDTERRLVEALREASRSRIAIVIAHRLSTIRDADLILVMEDGQIVEQGNHQELLELGRAYAQLYESQFSGPDTPEELPQPSGDDTSAAQ